MKGTLFVVIQLTILAFLVLRNGFYAEQYLAQSVQILAFFLAFWAIFTLSKSKLRIRPEPAEGSQLITKGPYRFIRHPMYSALIIYFASYLIDGINWINLVAVLLLIALLILKLNYEEKLLKKVFPNYSSYQKSSYRLIPYLY